MRVHIYILLGCVLACVVCPAHGAPHEFTVVGRVQRGIPSIFGLEMGDEVTIHYVLDSRDTYPLEPNFGQYVGGPASMELPSKTIFSSWGNMTVKPLSDLVYYQSAPDPLFSIGVNFLFPYDTITGDALPLELPLELATVRYFYITPGLDHVLSGEVISYHSRLIPEPHTAYVFMIGALLLRRRGD